MKLEFIDKVNEANDSIVRISNFDKDQVAQLINSIHAISISKQLDFKSIKFIETINCNLIFRISNEDV